MSIVHRGISNSLNFYVSYIAGSHSKSVIWVQLLLSFYWWKTWGQAVKLDGLSQSCTAGEWQSTVWARLSGFRSFPGGTSGKEPICNAGDVRDAGSIPGSGRSLGGGHGNPLQNSCLENPMDHGAWSLWGRKESDTTEVTWHAWHWSNSSCRPMHWRQTTYTFKIHLGGNFPIGFHFTIYEVIFLLHTAQSHYPPNFLDAFLLISESRAKSSSFLLLV